MAQSAKKIDGVIKLAGVIVAALGQGGLYARVPGHGRTFIPKDLGLKEGDVLDGNVSLVEVTYDENADGTKKETPLVRPEFDSFVSEDAMDRMEERDLKRSIIKAKAASLANIQWKAADFMATEAVVG